MGYDVLFERRLEKMKELRLISEEVEPHPGLESVLPWKVLTKTQKQVEARKMEIFAAMVHDLDTYVGVVIEYLKSIDQFDNTFILFMSDNGAEGHDLVQTWPFLADWIAACCDNSMKIWVEQTLILITAQPGLEPVLGHIGCTKGL